MTGNPTTPDREFAELTERTARAYLDVRLSEKRKLNASEALGEYFRLRRQLFEMYAERKGWDTAFGITNDQNAYMCRLLYGFAISLLLDELNGTA